MATIPQVSPGDVSRAVAESLPIAKRLFDELAANTGGNPGITRAGYGEGEQFAYDIVAQAAREAGLEITTDAAGNMYMTLAGRDREAPHWIAGSHLDSVPHGGNFDGAAGVLSALTALAALRHAGITPAVDLIAMAIRAEESNSWFGGRHDSHLGSRAALGLLRINELDTALRLDTGNSLAWHIDEAGFDSAAVRSGPAYLDAKRIAGFVELHIEQGPVLEHAGLAVGVVTSIRGSLRAKSSRCVGAYTHSGAVPHELRRDAVLAACELITELDRAWERVRSQGGDLVFTAGKFYTDPEMHGLSKVPGEVRFTLDIRSQDQAVMDMMRELAERLGREIGARRDVSFELGDFALIRPATMDPGLRSRLVEGCRALGVAAQEMPCGAGHDASEFVASGVPSAMIFVRNSGGSHNPDEAMEIADFTEGTRLMAWFLAGAS